MIRRLPAALVLAATLSLAAGCSGSSDGASPAASSKAASSGTSSAPSDGSTVTDDVWAERIKNIMPGMSAMTNDEVVASGKKVCATFAADPTANGRDQVVKDLMADHGLTSTGSNMWLGAAVSHFCGDQEEALIDAVG